jgi:simple sugar transport system permease protein
MIFGGFFTALIGFGLGMYLNIQLPPFLMIPLLLLVGMVGGALWAAIPGILKAKRGVHEVISTIMMNNIAALLITKNCTIRLYRPHCRYFN